MGDDLDILLKTIIIHVYKSKFLGMNYSSVNPPFQTGQRLSGFLKNSNCFNKH